MSFDVTLSFGTAGTPIAIKGTVLPEETTASAVNITVRLPKEKGTNQYNVRTTSTDRVSVNVLVYHILAPTAPPTIEVEAMTGDFVHAIQVEAQVATGPVTRAMCPMGCAVVLEPTY